VAPPIDLPGEETRPRELPEFDDDGDGTFERRVEYDRYGAPKTR
jgi:hypothetical protein